MEEIVLVRSSSTQNLCTQLNPRALSRPSRACAGRRAGPVPFPPGLDHSLTVARIWVWASRSSCLSPSVNAVTAYLVAL